MKLVKLALRITGAVLGGYGLTALLVELLTALLVQADMPRTEAIVSASMAGFLMYLAVLVWAFSTIRLHTLWAGLVAGSGAAYGLLLLAR